MVHSTIRGWNYLSGPVRTIGLVYRLPANILQLTLRSAVGHIGHKLFLRELRRSAIDRELAQLLSRLIEAIVPLCVLLLQDAFLFPSLLPAPFLLSPISGDSFCFQFASRLLKVTFISPLKFQERVYRQILKCSANAGFRAPSPSLTHITRRALARTWRPSSVTFLSEAQSMGYRPLAPPVTEVPFPKSAFQFRLIPQCK